MNPEFEECLDKRKIKEFSRGEKLAGKELEVVASDFEQAKISLKR